MMKSKSYFITGTDTNIGKTYVTCQLLDYYNRQQKPALGLKPVASGCYEREGQLLSEEVINLQQYNRDQSYKINGWKFAPSISPHLAAKEAKQRLILNEIADFCFDKQFAHFDYVFIEGAGGLMAPLNEEETWLDFLKLTQTPVILVVGIRLGCLNHALLTDAVLKQNQIPCAGWIANCVDNEMLAREENIKTLAAKMQMPQLATVPFNGKLMWR